MSRRSTINYVKRQLTKGENLCKIFQKNWEIMDRNMEKYKNSWIDNSQKKEIKWSWLTWKDIQIQLKKFKSENYYYYFFLVIYLFIYLFLAVLGLRFCARAFSSCGKRGPLFIAVRGPPTIAASLVAEHRLQTRRLSSCGSRA